MVDYIYKSKPRKITVCQEVEGYTRGHIEKHTLGARTNLGRESPCQQYNLISTQIRPLL
jgi:hypothetical protein